MIEPAFTDELRLLSNALRTEGFRFILVRHNRFSIYRDLAAWLRDQFTDRRIIEFRFEGKDYRTIIDFIRNAGSGIILIPDFDWLFREGNEAVCVGFNQRRDALAQLPVALVCFIQPSTLRQVSKRLPDWWSLRSLEVEFFREDPELTPEFLRLENRGSSLGGQTRTEKEAELGRLIRQIETANMENKVLLQSLYAQTGVLYFELGDFNNALLSWTKSLELCKEINNRKEEIIILNNISQIFNAKGDFDTAIAYLENSLKISQEIGAYHAIGEIYNHWAGIAYSRGDYDTALNYWNQSLSISRNTGDRKGEAIVLNNMSLIFKIRGNIKEALDYLLMSLQIQKEIGDKWGEGTTLNNIGGLFSYQGDYEAALQYWTESLKIRQTIQDRLGEGTTLSNISEVYAVKGNYDIALQYLLKSLKIRQEIGDINGQAHSMASIGAIYFDQNRDEEAIPFLIRARSIFQQINSKDIQFPDSILTAITGKIGQTRYEKIASKISAEAKDIPG